LLNALFHGGRYLKRSSLRLMTPRIRRRVRAPAQVDLADSYGVTLPDDGSRGGNSTTNLLLGDT
jgi:hypothetical protein